MAGANRSRTHSTRFLVEPSAWAQSDVEPVDPPDEAASPKPYMRKKWMLTIPVLLAVAFGLFGAFLATGAGANMRHSIGTGVVGGMLSATFLVVFFVPLFHVLIRRCKKHKSKSGNSESDGGDD
ncbi:MAG: efflux RND transporter permease subunit [Gammaproteobacteria bacterium]